MATATLQRTTPTIRFKGRPVADVLCYDHNRDEVTVQYGGHGCDYPFCDIQPSGAFTGTYPDGRPMAQDEITARLQKLAHREINPDGEIC